MTRHLALTLFSLLALAACDTAPAAPDAGTCEPGTAGCACIDGTMCGSELVCDLGICTAVDLVELEILDVNARSCEVVLLEESTEVLGVDFASGVQGTSIHESPRTAVTFLREEDASFAERSVLVRRTRDAAATLRLRRARCFDRDGNALAGEPIRIGG